MKRYVQICTLWLMFVFCASCKGRNRADLPIDTIRPETNSAGTSSVPDRITRNIIQDSKGNIWMATFGGVFKYDGKWFTNITLKVSLARFFSVLEDRKGNLWFGSVGSGVYLYNGKSFRNFTIKDGLAGNEVTCIYEDKTGNIWFGTEGGASRYDGKSFRNFTPEEGLSNNNLNVIIQDKTGRFWFGTRGNAYLYDGKTFTVFARNGKSFTNVRTITEDKKGNIWLGGPDGLWRYDGKGFTNFTTNFVGYIYEDKNGNIWTSSASADNQRWALSRYEEKSLSNKKPAVTEIASKRGMIFGILEANNGSIWFGALDGVHRYDGNTITDFNKNQHYNSSFKLSQFKAF